ncbi:MAG: twin-arginine translocase TatA/TatE family subunit [Conexivisphaerales archaeon]
MGDRILIGSATDIIIIIIVAVVLFAGSSKIPEIFRSMGKAKGEFKKGELESEMELKKMTPTNNNENADQLQKQIADLQKQLDELKKKDKQAD